MILSDLLKTLNEREAASLLLTGGLPPHLRISGALEAIGSTPLEPQEVRQITYAVLNDLQKEQFEQRGFLSMSFGIRGMARFELTLFTQKSLVSAVIKRFPLERPPPPSWLDDTLAWLDLGPGLVVVAGPVASGRSTTLGWWIDHLNHSRRLHIMSLEDPLTAIRVSEVSVVEQIDLRLDAQLADALQLASQAGADVIALDLSTDSLSHAMSVFSSGALVLAGLRAATLESAAATIAKALPRSCWPSLRGIVWRQSAQAGTALTGARLEALLAA